MIQPCQSERHLIKHHLYFFVLSYTCWPCHSDTHCLLIFPSIVPFDEDEKDPSVWFLDHDYLENMYGMFKKVNGMCCWSYKITHIYYMATIVRALWLAAEQALFSCNDRALWNFSSARRLLWVVSKTMCAWAKTTEKMVKGTTIFSITERKTSI